MFKLFPSTYRLSLLYTGYGLTALRSMPPVPVNTPPCKTRLSAVIRSPSGPMDASPLINRPSFSVQHSLVPHYSINTGRHHFRFCTSRASSASTIPSPLLLALMHPRLQYVCSICYDYTEKIWYLCSRVFAILLLRARPSQTPIDTAPYARIDISTSHDCAGFSEKGWQHWRSSTRTLYPLLDRHRWIDTREEE